MGFYDRHILPRLVDRTCGAAAMRPLRTSACAPLHGRVLELGFGSGSNVGLYPPTVEQIAAVEPSDEGWKLAAKKVAVSTVPIERVGLDGQSLPLPDNSVDSALTTFTLCTIPDVDAALAELHRVLAPGGTVCFLEHGRAPDQEVVRWQQRLEPIQRRVAGGCHLTRDIPAALAGAGFEITDLNSFYGRGMPRAFCALSVGAARAR